MWNKVKRNPRLAIGIFLATPGTSLLVYGLFMVIWKAWPFILLAAVVGGFIWGVAVVLDELTN